MGGGVRQRLFFFQKRGSVTTRVEHILMRKHGAEVVLIKSVTLPVGSVVCPLGGGGGAVLLLDQDGRCSCDYEAREGGIFGEGSGRGERGGGCAGVSALQLDQVRCQSVIIHFVPPPPPPYLCHCVF